MPAGVIGAVAPEMGIEYTQIGAPSEANSHGHVEQLAVDLERRPRRAEQRHARPLAEALEVAGRDLEDAAHVLGLRGTVDEDDRLRGLGQIRVVLDELPPLERDVGGGEERPHDVELGRRVEHDRAVPQVPERGRPHQAGVTVQRLGGAAADVEERARPVQDDVLRGGLPGHEEVARARGHGALDQLGREPHHAGLVDRGAGVAQHVEHRGALHPHAHALEDRERLGVDRRRAPRSKATRTRTVIPSPLVRLGALRAPGPAGPAYFPSSASIFLTPSLASSA